MPGSLISELLSHALVAFTLEVDGLVEQTLRATGFETAGVSLNVWTGVLRHLGGGAQVGALVTASRLTRESVHSLLGALERWEVVTLGRASRGSGRGVRADLPVEATLVGAAMLEAWQRVVPIVEKRWQAAALRTVLAAMPLPAATPDVVGFGGADPAEHPVFEAVAGGTVGAHGSLAAQLGRALWTMQLGFERVSPVPLAISAYVVPLAAGPLPVRELPRATGLSPELCAIGWLLEPYVVVKNDVASLTALGARAAAVHARTLPKLEERIGPGLRAALEPVLAAALPGALEPPSGTIRAGAAAPPLGGHDVSAVSHRRAREMAAQTAAFREGSPLPAFPRWDMNRGFGP